MNVIFGLIFAVGFAVCLYWLAAVGIGMFGDKVAVGRRYLEKRFRENGIPSDSLSDDQLKRIAFNAYSVAKYSNINRTSFDNTEYMEQLEFRVHIVVNYIKNAPLDEDSFKLAETLLRSEPFPS